MEINFGSRDEITYGKRFGGGKYSSCVFELLNSSHEALRLTFEDKKEARNCYFAVWNLRKRHNLPVIIHRHYNDVFVIKEDIDNEQCI